MGSYEEFEIKPTFNPLVVFGRSVFYALFYSVWGGMLLGVFAPILLQRLGVDPIDGLSWYIGYTLLASIPLVNILVSKFGYAKTKYRILTDRIEYFEGFLTIEEKTVKFSSITEVNLRKGFFQRFFNLGTIILSTNATGTMDNRFSKSGIKIKDIENPDTTYQQIKDRVNKDLLA